VTTHEPAPNVVAPIHDRIDHVRGPANAPLILEYGDYECPYSRQAFRAIERVERELPDGVRFAFRHFPLTEIHPHAMAAACAAEAAALQGRFWAMHELLFHRQDALADDDLRAYAKQVGLDSGRFEHERVDREVSDRVVRDVITGEVTGVVRGTPTLFINGALYEGPYDTLALIELLSR
jgi:protein-disulfide isomerase